MKQLTTLFITFILFSAVQCTSSIEKEIKAIDAELMQGHDTVMPKSMKLNDLKTAVLAKAADADSTAKSQATDIANRLQKSEDDMYQWMDNYSVAMNDLTDNAEKLERYKSLNTEIKSIDTETDRAMADAKAFLGEN